MATGKTKIEDFIIVNTETIAKMFGLTSRRVRQLVEEQVIDRVGHGRFNLVDTVNKYIIHLKLQASSNPSDIIEESYDYEKWLHEKAKRQKAEIELAHIKGEMHKSEDVEKVLNHMVMAFRAKMLALPSKLALQLSTIDDVNKIEAILERDIHQALSELSEYNPSMFFEEDSEEDADVTGEKDGTETNAATNE